MSFGKRTILFSFGSLKIREEKEYYKSHFTKLLFGLSNCFVGYIGQLNLITHPLMGHFKTFTIDCIDLFIYFQSEKKAFAIIVWDLNTFTSPHFFPFFSFKIWQTRGLAPFFLHPFFSFQFLTSEQTLCDRLFFLYFYFF